MAEAAQDETALRVDDLADMTGADAPAAPSRVPWGAWESAATVLVFCVPAVVAFSGPGPDAAGWALAGFAALGSLVLTLAGRGLKDTQAFLMIGVLTCAAWFLIGDALGHGHRLAPYAALIPALLVAHYHTVPTTLLRAVRRAEAACLGTEAEHGGHERLRGARRMIAGVIASVVALDLTPVAWFIVPRRWWKPAALVWMMAAVAAGGTFATLAAWRLPRGPKARPGAEAADAGARTDGPNTGAVQDG